MLKGIQEKVLLVVCIMTAATIFGTGQANPMQQNFDQYSAEYRDVAKNMISSGQLQNKINPQDYTKEDINNITAKGYYGDPNAMATDSKKAYAENTNTQALSDLQISGKQKIDPHNPAYKQAAETQVNADKILHDKTGSGYQCTEVSTGCTTETTTKTCQQSNHQNIACYRLPKVEIVEEPYVVQQVFTGYLQKINNWSYQFIPPESGIITSANIVFGNYNHNAFARIGFGRPQHTINVQCYFNGIDVGSCRLTGPFTGPFNGQLAVDFVDSVSAQAGVGIPVSFSGSSLHVAFAGSLYANINLYSFSVTMNVTRYKREARVSWQDTCTNLETSACVKTSEVCTEAGGTRNISGVDVTLDCWRYDLTYSCGYNTIDSCKPFADKCNFLSQRCIEEDSGYCLTYEKTYSCVQQNCDHKELKCGDPQSIIFNQKIPQGSANDFAKAVAGFAGVTAAGNDVKKTQDELQIFKGKSNDCGEAGMGLYDCCDGGGNILRNCSETEKALKEARDKNLATFVGRYCAKKVLGVCLVYHQTWCVFESKLTRIIQEQGRRDQLHISFGDGENPNCTGLTPEQLQQINFDQIDFSEIYADLAIHNPSDKSIEEAMSGKFKTNKETPQYLKKDTKEAQDQPMEGAPPVKKREEEKEK